MPIMARTLQQPIKSAGLLAKKEKLDVIQWRIDYPSFNVYAERLQRYAPRVQETLYSQNLFIWEISSNTKYYLKTRVSFS